MVVIEIVVVEKRETAAAATTMDGDISGVGGEGCLIKVVLC